MEGGRGKSQEGMRGDEEGYGSGERVEKERRGEDFGDWEEGLP